MSKIGVDGAFQCGLKLYELIIRCRNQLAADKSMSGRGREVEEEVIK